MGYKLRDIVKEYLIETGDTQLNRYPRFYQHAVSGLREFNLESSGIIQSSALPIKVNDTVDLPLDYLKYIKIGLLGQDGNVYALGSNPKLSLTAGFDDCGAPLKLKTTTQGNLSLPSASSGIYYGDNGMSYRNGSFMGRIFGVNGGLNPFGEYRIDVENHQILLARLIPDSIITNNTAPTSIILEYMADISAVNGDFDVHPFMVEALKSWMYYKSIQRDRARGNGEKEIARRDYFAEETWAKKRFSQHTLDEWKAAFRSGNSASVKF